MWERLKVSDKVVVIVWRMKRQRDWESCLLFPL